MIHFAFPNVDTGDDDFLGCGRYVAVENYPGQHYMLPTGILDEGVVKKSVSLLVYQPLRIRKTIYWKKDSNHKYFGPSMDLAYFLVLTHRTRTLKNEWAHDIWCTGIIALVGNRPALTKVEKHGFELKLWAFLAETNLDQLFIVPTDNIPPNSEAFGWCQDHGTPVLSLSEFRDCTFQDISDQKVVVTVSPDELDFLLCVLFRFAENPYKGLSAFEEKDARYFFGREELIDSLWQTFQRLHEAPSDTQTSLRLMAILGPSGSGKSSVARAGLVPKIKSDLLPNQRDPKVVVFTPGIQPFYSLARELALLADQKQAITEKICTFESMMRQPNAQGEMDGLSRVISKLLNSKSVQLILLIDQGEELYSQCENEDERLQFINALLHFVTNQLGGTAIITLRDGFLEQTQSHPEFNNAIVNNAIIVPVMNRSNLRKVIETPSLRGGYRFKPETVIRLIVETEGRKGTLPLLEFALTQIWEGLVQGIEPEDTLRQIGGVSGAIAERAEALYATLNNHEQAIAQRVFLDLIHPVSEASHTRKRVSVSDLVSYQENQEHVYTILQKFSAPHTRLLTRSYDAEGRDVVEFTHEALITNWQRLKEWMETDWEFRMWRERLGARMPQAENGRYDESTLLRGATLAIAEAWLNKRRVDISQHERQFIEVSLQVWKKLQRRKKIGVTTILIVTIALAILFGLLWKNSETQRWKAEMNEINAITASSEALFASNKKFDALIESIRASKKLKHMAGVSEKTRKTAIAALQQALCFVRECNRLEGHDNRIMSASFSPDGQMLATASWDGTAKLWSRNGKELQTLTGHKDRVNSASFSPDGQMIATASKDKTIKVWNLDGEMLQTLHGHKYDVWSVTFSPDGQMLASGSTDKTVKLWSLDGKELRTLSGFKAGILSVSFSPDNNIITAASYDSTIKLWNRDGQELQVLRGHDHAVFSISFSPDGQMIATASKDKTVKLWRLDEGDGRFYLWRTIPAHEYTVTSVSFSPDGQTIATTSSEDGMIKLWNLDAKELQAFRGHDARVNSVSFSPDGQIIATASYDGTVKIWRLNNKYIKILSGHKHAVTSVSFRSGWKNNSFR